MKIADLNSERLAGLALSRWFAFVITASLLKTGVAVWDFYALYPELMDTKSATRSPFGTNMVPNLIAQYYSNFGVIGKVTWWINQVLLLILVIYQLIKVSLNKGYQLQLGVLVCAVLLSTGLSPMIWREIGRYDSFVLLGALIAFQAKTNKGVVAGGLLASVSAPEQVLLSALLYWVTSRNCDLLKPYNPHATKYLGSAIFGFLTVYTWFGFHGELRFSRVGGIIVHITEGESPFPMGELQGGFFLTVIQRIIFLSSSGYSAVWSVFGSIVLFLVWAGLADTERIKTVKLSIFLVPAPIIMGTLFGMDLTRDAVSLAAPTLIATTLGLTSLLEGKRKTNPLVTDNLIAILIIGVSLLPMNYIFWNENELSWRFMLEHAVLLIRGEFSGLDYSLR
jgi:hypothetical protein